MREINIRVFWELLLRNLRPILVVMAVFAAAFAAYTSAFTADTYTSTCSVYVMNITKDSAGTISGISAAGLDASQRMVSEYITMLKSTRLLSEVHDRLQEDGYSISVSGIRNALTLTSVDETAMLQIKATTGNPALSQRICTELQDVAEERVKEIMLEIGYVSTVDEPSTATKTSPPVVRNGILGALIGLVLTYGFFLLGYLMDNTVKEEKDLKDRFDVNVLGAVPNFNPAPVRKKDDKKKSSVKEKVEQKTATEAVEKPVKVKKEKPVKEKPEKVKKNRKDGN